MTADTSFPTEAQLQAALADRIAHHLVGKHVCAVGREVAWGGQVVDIVAATLPPAADPSLLPPSLGRTTNLEVYALAALVSRRRASSHLLASLFHTDAAQLQATTLQHLLSVGLIERDGPTCYVATSWASSLPTRLIAVEAKLARWRQAAAQARAYLTVADYCYIALPEQAAERARCEDAMAAESGMGILGVGVDHRIRTLKRARACRHQRTQLLPWVERLSVLRDLANGRQKWTVVY